MTRAKRIFTALLTLALLGVVAHPATARSTQVVYFEAPRDLTRVWVTPQARLETFDRLESIGVRALRINLRWHDVAPGADSGTRPAGDMRDPASYAWAGYGATIAEAKRRGWKLLISPSAPVPKWATEARADTVTRPRTDEFQEFTTAAARAFAGAGVIWSIWNEPNLERFLRPQKTGGRFVAGRIYRKLFLAGRRGIESVQPRSTVLFGETAPSGVATSRQKPIAFLRDALCVTSTWKRKRGCSKLSIDGVAHHPYRSVRGIPKSSDDVTYQRLSRLTRALDRMAKGGAIPKRRPIYLTEFGIQSTPDELFGVSEQRQLEERARAERIAYYNGRVKAFSQYLLTDDNPTGTRSWGGFETGLIDHTGDVKRSFKAFALTLDARPKKGGKLSIWGLARLAEGTTKVRVERRLRGWKTWHRWKTVTTNSRRAFNVSDRRRTGAKYRLVWTDDEGETHTGQYVRAFSD